MFLYRPLFAAQEKLQRRLEPALEDVKLESDVAEEALARAERAGAPEPCSRTTPAASARPGEPRARLQRVIEVFEREFREGLSEVYEENQRGTLVFQLRGDGAPGAPLERFVDAFGDEHWQVSLNRLETYDDQHAAYDALKRWLGPSHPEAVAAVEATDALVLELFADDERFFGEAGEGLRSGGFSGALDRVAGESRTTPRPRQSWA
ncbi:MAG: hypothetical protein R3F62_26945 [Planctomycetota bacterium]